MKCFLIGAAAHFFLSLQSTTYRRAARLTEYTATIIVRQLDTSHSRGFAFRHAGNR
jgi:hypothetical protein